MKKLFFFIFFFSFLSIFRELNITLMFHDFKIGPNAMDKPSLHPLPCFEIYYSLSNYTRVFWKHLNCSSCATIIYLFIYLLGFLKTSGDWRGLWAEGKCRIRFVICLPSTFPSITKIGSL